jgi:glycosyltransferase involved in cell wall biosynthesis
MGRRILIVARWYPSHDSPIRGVFVADLVRGLLDAGNEVVVASFETVALRGPAARRDARGAVARSAWQAAAAIPEAMSSPRSWGAGAPVARLPVVRTWGVDDSVDELARVDRHAEMLQAFGTALTKRWPIDVIHAHTGAPDGLAAARLADTLEIGLVVSEHDSTIATRLSTSPELAVAYRTLVSPVERRAIAAVSPALRDAILGAAELSGGIEVLPNAIPLDRFPLAEATHRDGDELLWVGARADHKGTPLLIDAFAEVRRVHPTWRLRLVGPASEETDDRLRRQAERLGVGTAVSLEPAADRSGVRNAMQRASIFVHPSPWETFGMVAAEAIASGLPVAATPSGGVESIVGSDGTLGVIAADTTATALAAAILDVARRRSTFDPTAMRADIAARFGQEQVVAAATRLYDGIAAGHAGPNPAANVATPTLNTTPAVVVGLHGTSAARLAALPPGALSGLTVVTGPGPTGASGAPDGPAPTAADASLRARAGRHVVIDPSAGFRTAVAGAQGAMGWLRRRQLMKARADIELRDRQELLRQAIRSDDAFDDRLIVAVDADDVVAILDALPGTRLAPGSLRWLADRSDADDALMAPSHDALLGV